MKPLVKDISGLMTPEDLEHIQRCNDFYEAHRKELEKEHYGKYVILQNEEIMAIVSTPEDAFRTIGKLKDDGKLTRTPYTIRIGKGITLSRAVSYK